MKGTFLIAAAVLAALDLASCSTPSNSSSTWSRSFGSGYASSYSRYGSYGGSGYRGSYSGSSYASSASSSSPGLLNSLTDFVCSVKPGG